MKFIYKIIKEGKTYTFTTRANASLLLRIPQDFVNFNQRQMQKYRIDKIEIYDFKTQKEIKVSKELTRCQFCGETFMKREKQQYCHICGNRLWNELKYNAMQKLYGKQQTK